MFIQGNLQAVFDALYAVGAIDPVLKADWLELNKEMVQNNHLLENAIDVINSCEGNPTLLQERIAHLDSKSISFIAMEVAREFAEFQECQTLH
jgi:hypothetical protein